MSAPTESKLSAARRKYGELCDEVNRLEAEICRRDDETYAIRMRADAIICHASITSAEVQVLRLTEERDAARAQGVNHNLDWKIKMAQDDHIKLLKSPRYRDL